MKNLEKILKALANRKRLDILKILKTHPELSVGEIADKINLSFRSTSRHLNILYHAELIEQERRGNLVECRIATPIPKILIKLFPLMF